MVAVVAGKPVVIGNKLKALRLQSNMSQVELADKSGLTQGHIAKIENDQTDARVSTVQKMLRGLGVDFVFGKKIGTNTKLEAIEDKLDQLLRLHG